MSCYHSIVIDAPVGAVWNTLRDFHALSWATGVVERVERVGERSGDQVGARRVINGAFHETLQALDDVNRELKYSIDDGPDPLSKDRLQGYVGRVRAFPVTQGGSTFVEWSTRWDHADGDVKSFCDPLYMALLAALAAHHA